MASRRFLLPTALVVVVILHGSLYPYDFRVLPGGIGPVATLFGSWNSLDKSYGDIAANILLYVPFGFFVALAIGRGRTAKLVIATLAGLALCTAIELAQYYEAARLDSMSDVYFNTLGSVAGALAALLLGGLGRRLRAADIAPEPVAVLLLVAMLAYHLFPYVPTIDLHKYWHALRPLLVAPHASATDTFRYFALWLTTSCLIGRIVGDRRSRVGVPLFMAGVFAAKVAIVSLIVTPAEAIGAAAALVLWLAIGGGRRFATTVTVLVLAAAIVAGRLAPLHFLAEPHAFGWLPFRGFMHGSFMVNTDAMLEKFFLYGSLIWLAAEALLPLWLATLLVGALLFATSVAETYLPGRSAEITDALMAVMIGLLLTPFRRGAPSAAGRVPRRAVSGAEPRRK